MNMCKPGDAELSYQSLRLEQGNRLGKWRMASKKEYVQGRRVPTTKGEFQSLCDLNEAGTFFARCERWHKMDKKLVDVQNGGPDLVDEIRDSKMLCNEDKRAMAAKET